MAATSSSDWYALSPGSKKLGRNALDAQRSGIGNAAASPEMMAPRLGGERASNSSSGRSACSRTARGQTNFEKFMRQTHDDIEKGSAYTIPINGFFDSAERRIDIFDQSCQKNNPIDSSIGDTASIEASLHGRPNQTKINDFQQNGPKFQIANKTLGPILQKSANLESCANSLRQQSPTNK